MYDLAGREISRITRYADSVVQLDPLPGDTGLLLDAVDALHKRVSTSAQFEGVDQAESGVAAVLFNGNFNHSTDIQGLLGAVRPKLQRSARVVVVLYNWYFAWLFRLADRLGLRQGEPFITFITQSDLKQIARLAGFELVRLRPTVYVPWHFFGLGSLLNVVMPALPGLRWAAGLGAGTAQLTARSADRSVQTKCREHVDVARKRAGRPTGQRRHPRLIEAPQPARTRPCR